MGDSEVIDSLLRYIPFVSVTLLAVLTTLSAKANLGRKSK